MQRVNPDILRDKDILMKNISSVMNYLYLNQEPFRFGAMNLVETKEGGYYYRDKKGNYWRMIELISKQVSKEITVKPEDAYQWACFLGEFMASLDEFPVRSLREIVFNQKTIRKRLEEFAWDLEVAIPSSKSDPKDEIEYVFEYLKRAKVMDQWLIDKNLLPLSPEGSLARAM